nr:TonB-dependent receptor [uncultured Alistipes sp.]
MKKLFLLMLSVFVTAAASAQVTTSGMNGTVTDEQGLPLVGATVIAVHTPSGTQYGAVTNKDGRYNLQGLRAGGPYTVTFSYVGYQSVEFPGLDLPLGETVARNAYLKDSQTLEAVVVTADGRNSSMNINRAGAVTSVSSEQIELMPTVSRSMNDIMRLTPQASSTTSGLAIGGGNYRQSYVTVDGAAFNNAFGIGGNLPSGGSPISLDALEQISVSVTPYDVRQSGFTGGAINAVTKSGTNDFKVSAYNYYKSDALQGAKYDGGELKLQEEMSNTLGFSIGAPIVKDKLFIFTNFEYEWTETPGTSRLARESEDQEYGAGTQYNRPTVAQMEAIKSFLQQNFGYDPGRYPRRRSLHGDLLLRGLPERRISRSGPAAGRNGGTQRLPQGQPNARSRRGDGRRPQLVDEHQPCGRRNERFVGADRADAHREPQHERHHAPHPAGVEHHVGTGHRRRQLPPVVRDRGRRGIQQRLRHRRQPSLGRFAHLARRPRADFGLGDPLRRASERFHGRRDQRRDQERYERLQSLGLQLL